MEIDHQPLSGFLDPLAEGGHVFQILADTRPPVLVGCFRRIDKQAHSLRIPSHGLRVEVGEQVAHRLSVPVTKADAGLLVGCQQRDVAAYVFLRMCEAGQENGAGHGEREDCSSHDV